MQDQLKREHHVAHVMESWILDSEPWIPDSRYWIPVFDSGTRIMDSYRSRDSAFLELYSEIRPRIADSISKRFT